MLYSEAAQPLKLVALAEYDVAPCARHMKHSKVNLHFRGRGTLCLTPGVQAYLAGDSYQ